LKTEVESFVIIDDDADMGELLPYLVQTSGVHGLSDDKREEASLMGGQE
jgi:hypothetical protein